MIHAKHWFFTVNVKYLLLLVKFRMSDVLTIVPCESSLLIIIVRRVEELYLFLAELPTSIPLCYAQRLTYRTQRIHN